MLPFSFDVVRIGRLGAIALVAAIASWGSALPGSAQEVLDNDPEVSGPDEPEMLDRDELYDDDTGLPEGGSPPDRGLPDAGEVLGDNVIVIDGQIYEYDPSDLENNPILENLTPLENGESNESPSSRDETGLDTSGTENDSLIIYPPADSIEDLEPEDILGD